MNEVCLGYKKVRGMTYESYRWRIISDPIVKNYIPDDGVVNVKCFGVQLKVGHLTSNKSSRKWKLLLKNFNTT